MQPSPCTNPKGTITANDFHILPKLIFIEVTRYRHARKHYTYRNCVPMLYYWDSSTLNLLKVGIIGLRCDDPLRYVVSH
jgi:hypothetical protein